MVTFSKAGYDSVTSPVPTKFNAWVVGNIFIPGWILWIGVDALTGNFMKVNGTISAHLPVAGGGDSGVGNAPDSIAAWLGGRLRKYAELAQSDPPAQK